MSTINRGIAAVAVAAAVMSLAACGGDERPKTPALSSDVISRVDGGDCFDLVDNLDRARQSAADDLESTQEWGRQYEALILWKGRQLGCDWAS